MVTRVQAAWVLRITRQGGLVAPAWMTHEWVKLHMGGEGRESRRVRVLLLLAVARRELQTLLARYPCPWPADHPVHTESVIPGPYTEGTQDRPVTAAGKEPAMNEKANPTTGVTRYQIPGAGFWLSQGEVMSNRRVALDAAARIVAEEPQGSSFQSNGERTLSLAERFERWLAR